jgi:Mce-associated membrane protein
VTLVVEKPETPPATQEGSSMQLAPWYVRAGAFAVDVGPAVAVVATIALVALMVPLGSTWWWLLVSAAVAVGLLTVVNRWLLPTYTGWSLGRALSGIAVVRPDEGHGEVAFGGGRMLLRDVAHLLDTASVMVGWLWPLWDSRRRTFADLLLHTEVRRVEPDRRPGNIRRLTAGVMLAAALLCIAGAAVGYLVVYSGEEATDQTRAQLAIQGPKMVAQMLTYDPKSLHDDFARAQSLTSDKYREQLAKQQELVEKANPVTNEYWVIDSAIQSATPDRATMLVFMQGRRGAPPDERYLSATVQAAFTKGRDARWRVDDLTVLTKPTLGKGGQ